MSARYWRQSADEMSVDQRMDWFIESIRESRGRGAPWVRVSVNRDLVPGKTLSLVEGWEAEPKDQGEPEFAVTYGEMA